MIYLLSKNALILHIFEPFIGIFCIVMIFYIIAGILTGKWIIYRKPKKTRIDKIKFDIKLNLYNRKWLNNLKKEYFSLLTKSRPKILLKIILLKKYKKRADNLIIFHHGITSDGMAGIKYSPLFLNSNSDFAYYDARGWGIHKKESWCTYGVQEKNDLLQVVEYFRNNSKYKKITLYGESNGGKTVISYAAHYEHLNYVDAYILDSPFVSFFDVIYYNIKRVSIVSAIKLYYPVANLYILWKTKSTVGNNNDLKYLKNIKKPCFLIFSKNDSSIPISQFNYLKNNLTDVEILLLKNSPHCMSIIFNNKEYLQSIKSFYNKILYSSNNKIIKK